MEPLQDIVCVSSIKKIMEIFGGKWSFLVLGELHSGAKRFNELCRSLELSTKSLSDTLKMMEANQIIKRTVHATTPVTVEYSLTEKGRDFEKVFFAMKEWGIKWLNDETMTLEK